MGKKQYRLLITGDVVGIGYRSWMKREAQNLGVVGWVKNREDKTVEAVVQGEEKETQEMLEKAKKGPEVAWVESVSVTEQPVDKDLMGFEVIY